MADEIPNTPIYQKHSQIGPNLIHQKTGDFVARHLNLDADVSLRISRLLHTSSKASNQPVTPSNFILNGDMAARLTRHS